jgi:phospholipid-binding lipoprotein MlaA
MGEFIMKFIRNWALSVVVLSAFAVISIPQDGRAQTNEDGSYNIGDINSNVQVSDPIEPVNRAVYGFNRFLDKILLKPIAKTYKFIMPDLARRGVSNALRNLTEPVTFINAILQADGERAATSFWRFTINSTWGIAGLGDVASDAGLKYRKEDAGQTIGVYGVGEGPYIMWPLFGPSNLRDSIGWGVDVATDPFTYIFDNEGVMARTLVSGLDSRTNNLELVDEIDRVSLDPYAAIRSLYTQKRKDDIKNGAK